MIGGQALEGPEASDERARKSALYYQLASKESAA
jgi:hypothetical protein